MRKAIFLGVAGALSAITNDRLCPSGIPFVDLWNDEVNQLNGGTAFALPAVFVEFEQIDWHQENNGVRRATAGVRLHVITRAVPTHGHKDPRMAEALALFDLLNDINRAMQGLRGDNFAGFQLTTSATNHAHTELVESVERFTVAAQDITAMRRDKRIVGLSAAVSPPKV